MIMNKKNFYLICLVIIGAIAIATMPLWLPSRSTALHSHLANSTATTDTHIKPIAHKVESFDFSIDKTSLTQNQLDQHKKLYEGYVAKWNEIEQKLASIDTTDANNITYSIFRSLKLAETFAKNGSLLHELYFENLKQGTTMGPKTQDMLIKNYGSIDNFKKDLIACARSCRGWAITFYAIDTKRLHNFILEAHNETVPLLSIPIIVIDVYEHAYMIDYGIDRAKYLHELWGSINWDVVEKRIIDWVLAKDLAKQEKLVSK